MTDRHQPAVLLGADLAAMGIPTLEAYTEAYLKRTGRAQWPNLDYYAAYNFFRLAGILQGIVGRVRDGTVTIPSVPAGVWQVAEVIDPMWAAITPATGTVTVPTGGTGTFTAGNVRPAPISGVVAEADAMSHTMNICLGVCTRWLSGTGATPTVSISPPTRRLSEPLASSVWAFTCTITRTSPSPASRWTPCVRS